MNTGTELRAILLDADSIGDRLASFRARIRDGDDALVDALDRIALLDEDEDARCIALDIIAGARCERHWQRVISTLLRFLADPSEEIRMQGVASAGLLPRTLRGPLLDAVATAAHGSERLQRAAAAFLREAA